MAIVVRERTEPQARVRSRRARKVAAVNERIRRVAPSAHRKTAKVGWEEWRCDPARGWWT